MRVSRGEVILNILLPASSACNNIKVNIYLYTEAVHDDEQPLLLNSRVYH